jgi:outer membrane biosynthesis protein TonB
MRYHEENLRTPLIVSTSLHVGAMLVLYFGIPVFFAPPPAPPWRPVPVDIVEIGEITNTRIRNTEEQEAAKTAPPTKPAPAPEVKPPEPKPEPPKPAAKEEIKPDDAVLPTPAEKPKPPKPEKPKEEPKKETKPQVDPLASVLKNVAKLKPSPAPVQDARPDEKKNDGVTNVGSTSNQGPALADRLTISQEDALRRQISGCWNMPIGARNAGELIVEVLIEVNEDRTVRSAQVVDQVKFNSDTHFRAAAEAALRALRHPKCSPLELPPDQYEQWKTIRFNFDPRDML